MHNNVIDLNGRLKARKAVILARVSSKEQEEGYSIDAQKYRLETYCNRHDLAVLKIFSIVESSTQGDRRQFMEMIKFVKAQREPIAIVADKVDRVQRSFREYPLLDELIRNGRIELHFNTENYIIHKESASQERLMWSMGVIMAQSYTDSLRDNVKRAIEQKVRQGEWVSKAPIGYLNAKEENGRSTVILDPDRVLLVKRIFEEYAKGMSTITEITKMAREWGLKNNVGKKDFLPRAQIHQILNNPFYYGQMLVKKKLFDHRYPPLISKTLFDQCQTILKGWHKKPFKWGGKEYIFRGLLTCSVSGRVVTSDTKIKKYKNGKEAQWTYLTCANPDNPSKLMWIREEVILKQVENIFENFCISPETLNKITGHIRQTDQAERTFVRRQMGELQRQHSMIQNRLDTLMDLLLDGTITKQDFEQKKQRLRNQQKDIEEKTAAHRESDDNFKNTLIRLLSVISDSHRLFLASPIEKKRELINFLFSNLSLKGTTLCYCLRKPFDEFIKCTDIPKWCRLVDKIRTDNAMREYIQALPKLEGIDYV